MRGIEPQTLAVRDNENAAAAFTVNPVRAKLVSFAVSVAASVDASGFSASAEASAWASRPASLVYSLELHAG